MSKLYHFIRRMDCVLLHFPSRHEDLMPLKASSTMSQSACPSRGLDQLAHRRSEQRDRGGTQEVLLGAWSQGCLICSGLRCRGSRDRVNDRGHRLVGKRRFGVTDWALLDIDEDPLIYFKPCSSVWVWPRMLSLGRTRAPLHQQRHQRRCGLVRA